MRRHESLISSFGLGGWDRVYLFKSERRPEMEGKSFEELALAGQEFLGAFTWAGWFFRRLVRETHDFRIEEAVRMLAAAPAERLGLTDRGRIEKGARADMVVFDPGSFRERGTLEEPNRLAEGVAHVVVNGVLTMQRADFPPWEDGQGERVCSPGT